jgi:hypothetical protein
MRRFVLGWKKLGHERRLKAYIVNYADDLVICCRSKATDALVTMRGHDDGDEVDGERNQDAGLSGTEEKFDFLG